MFIDPMDVLKAAGIRLGLDWDNSLEYEIPELLDAYKLREFLDKHADYFAMRLASRARVHQERYLGGPLQGKHHHCERLFEAVRLERARYAVYGRPKYDEPRLFYLGEATSKKRAKLLAFKVLEEKHGYVDVWKRLRDKSA